MMFQQTKREWQWVFEKHMREVGLHGAKTPLLGAIWAWDSSLREGTVKREVGPNLVELWITQGITAEA